MNRIVIREVTPTEMRSVAYPLPVSLLASPTDSRDTRRCLTVAAGLLQQKLQDYRGGIREVRHNRTFAANRICSDLRRERVSEKVICFIEAGVLEI